MKKIFYSIILFLSVQARAQVNINDSLALIDFDNAVSPLSWPHAQPVSEWEGVTVMPVNSKKRVTGINLSAMGLSGDISALPRLKQLQSLDLSYNSFSGKISPGIGNISTLQSLNFKGNSFSGKIPASFANLTQLISLDLGYNQLTGNINVVTALTNLQDLFLKVNHFSGVIPSNIGDLTHLYWLDISENQLTDTIPAAIGNLTNLNLLFISYNKLKGKIPSSITNLQSVTVFQCDRNNLSGSLPDDIGNLDSLTELSFMDNNLSGNIPSSLTQLTKLQYLILGGNKLTGKIPSDIDNLSGLIVLDLSTNKLTGKIPAVIGNLSQLERLDLYQNKLSGKIPASLGNLGNLTELDLDYNQLTDSIPGQLGNLTNLNRLVLDGNNLKYKIPASLANLPSSCFVAVDRNKFTFSGMDVLPHFTDTRNQFQDTTLPVIYENGVLSVATDDANNNNVYNWNFGYDQPVSTLTGDPHYTPTTPGSYIVYVTNSWAPNLRLQSDLFTVPALTAKSISPAKAAPGISLKIFPNPTASSATLYIDQSLKGAAVTVSDANGKILWQQFNVQANQVKLPVEKFAGGIYYVNVRSGNEMKTLKLMKQ